MKPIFNASVLFEGRDYVKFYTKKDRKGQTHSGVTIDSDFENMYAYPYDLAWKLPFADYSSTPEIKYIKDGVVKNSIVLRPDQAPYVEKLLKKPRGIFVSKPGTGKTVMCLDLIAKANLKVLILVNTLYLLEQWREECKKLLDYTPGMIGGTKFIVKDITVATFQTLSRSPEKLKHISNEFSLVIVDECHHIPALTFSQVLRGLNSIFKLGVTGTLERKDNLHFIAKWYLSDNIIVNTTDDTMQPEITIVRTNLKIPSGENFVESLTALGTSERVLNIVRSVVSDYSERLQLVLSSRVATVELLAKTYKNAIAITGMVGDRDNLNDRLLDSKLIISTLLNEGVNIPYLDTLHLIHPSNNLPQLEQRIARINRPVEGKPTPLVFDYWFKSNKKALGFNILTQQANRLAYYRKQGYQIYEIQF